MPDVLELGVGFEAFFEGGDDFLVGELADLEQVRGLPGDSCGASDPEVFVEDVRGSGELFVQLLDFEEPEGELGEVARVGFPGAERDRAVVEDVVDEVLVFLAPAAPAEPDDALEAAVVPQQVHDEVAGGAGLGALLWGHRFGEVRAVPVALVVEHRVHAQRPVPRVYRLEAGQVRDSELHGPRQAHLYCDLVQVALGQREHHCDCFRVFQEDLAQQEALVREHRHHALAHQRHQVPGLRARLPRPALHPQLPVLVFLLVRLVETSAPNSSHLREPQLTIFLFDLGWFLRLFTHLLLRTISGSHCSA